MATTTALRTFLEDKAKSSSAQPEIDWEARRDKWLANISALYKCVKRWLADLEREGVVRYLPSPKVTISEDRIGDYGVDVLTILVGKQRVAFYPKGTLIVGAEGRIDIRGQKGIRTIILNGRKWSIVERTPTLATYPFNEESFRDALEEVME